MPLSVSEWQEVAGGGPYLYLSGRRWQEVALSLSEWQEVPLSPSEW